MYTHAPSIEAATRLADAAVKAMEQHLNSLADDEQVAENNRVVLRQLGVARGGIVNGGLAVAIAVIAFLVAFGLAYALLRHLNGDRSGPSRLAVIDSSADDAWPHTARLMPWMFAVFLAVIWLVPFSDIQLNAPMPIDLTFDRLVLPVVIAAWALALLLGGSTAPRLRVTRIHLAVGAFVICAFLSVIFNAGQLNQSLELERAFKQLPLLLSYVCVFVIASSAVRSGEIRAFLTYTLWLASICAVGVLFEYRFKQNVFYTWSDKLLPGNFLVGTADSAALDDIGRRVVRGPALVPLEAVAMLAMGVAVARAPDAVR